MTGGRLRRVAKCLDADKPFCFTYGDGVSDVDNAATIKAHGKPTTMTTVVPWGRYGAVRIEGKTVHGFIEKPPGENAFINGGFFVLSPGVIPYIAGDQTPWEMAPLQTLASEGQLQAHCHTGFWHAMDTLRNKTQLEAIWDSGKAPWKLWA